MMQMTRNKKSLSLFLCMVLIAAMALSTIGCGDKHTSGGSGNNMSFEDAAVLGEGETMFYFSVTDKDGNVAKFVINTDKTTVGAALLELDLIAGDEDAYGLYVKTVNGITVEYNKDGVYWAFYVNGAYASSGVDTTDITEGTTYSFKVE